jgi:hypothetical protein
MLNVFRRFFTFADLAFASEANGFFDPSYFIIRKITILTVLSAVGLMAFAVRLIPRKHCRRHTRSLLFGFLAGFLGVAVIAGTSAAFLQPPDTVKWDNSYDSAAVYESFSDTKKSLLLSGIYQYTFRDFCRTCFGAGSLFKGPKNEAAFASLDTYFDGANSEPAENEMTGVLAGKNLILIQLEAIDTWLLTEETMPNLYRIKQKSLDFMNHYAAVYTLPYIRKMLSPILCPASSGMQDIRQILSTEAPAPSTAVKQST